MVPWSVLNAIATDLADIPVCKSAKIAAFVSGEIPDLSDDLGI